MQVNRAEAGYTDCTQGISLEECNYFTKRFLWAGRWETNLLDKFTVGFFCHRTNEFSTSSFECSIKGHNILLFLNCLVFHPQVNRRRGLSRSGDSSSLSHRDCMAQGKPRSLGGIRNRPRNESSSNASDAHRSFSA